MVLKGVCPVTGRMETVTTRDIYAGEENGKETYIVGRVDCRLPCTESECQILKQKGISVNDEYHR